MCFTKKGENMNGKTFNVALYIRLSREDGDKQESENLKDIKDDLLLMNTLSKILEKRRRRNLSNYG